MMKRFFCGWNVIRLVRMLLGSAATVQGIVQKESWLTIAGIVILIGALFNVGCCSSAGCSVPSSKKEVKKVMEYEEVDNTK